MPLKESCKSSEELNGIEEKLNKRVAELCKSLEQGGEAITDSALALTKNNVTST